MGQKGLGEVFSPALACAKPLREPSILGLKACTSSSVAPLHQCSSFAWFCSSLCVSLLHFSTLNPQQSAGLDPHHRESHSALGSLSSLLPGAMYRGVGCSQKAWAHTAWVSGWDHGMSYAECFGAVDSMQHIPAGSAEVKRATEIETENR